MVFEAEIPAPQEPTANENTTLPEEIPLPRSRDLSPCASEEPTETATIEHEPEPETPATKHDEATTVDEKQTATDELDETGSITPTAHPHVSDDPQGKPQGDAEQGVKTAPPESSNTTESLTSGAEQPINPQADTPVDMQPAKHPVPVEAALEDSAQRGESQTDDKDKPQEEPKIKEQLATVPPDLVSPTSDTFTPRLLRRSYPKKEKTKAGKMSNPASPTMGGGWGIASPPSMSLDKALEAADPFADGEFERRMRTVSANREAERSAKIAEKEKLERALFLQRRSTFDVGDSPTSSHTSVVGSTHSSGAAETGSNAEERPIYALKRANTDRAEKKKKLAAERKRSKKSDWPDAWPEEFDEEATMPQEPGHPSMWPELHGRASPSPIRGRSGYRTPTPLGQHIEVGRANGQTGDDSADHVGVLQETDRRLSAGGNSVGPGMFIGQIT